MKETAEIKPLHANPMHDLCNCVIKESIGHTVLTLEKLYENPENNLIYDNYLTIGYFVECKFTDNRYSIIGSNTESQGWKYAKNRHCNEFSPFAIIKSDNLKPFETFEDAQRKYMDILHNCGDDMLNALSVIFLYDSGNNRIYSFRRGVKSKEEIDEIRKWRSEHPSLIAKTTIGG